MKKVVASAPGKLLLFGDHAVVYGHPCIVTAINQRMFVEVTERDDSLLVVDAPDQGNFHFEVKVSDLALKETPSAGAFLVATTQVLVRHIPNLPGIHVKTSAQFSHVFGFGSSSAVTVAYIVAVLELLGKTSAYSQKEVFSWAYEAVLAVQGVGSGFDLAAALWGGTLVYVTPAKIVEPLALTALPLIVGYTGKKVSTSLVVKEVAAAKAAHPERIEPLFTRSTEIVLAAKNALLSQDWLEVGRLMNLNQSLLAELGVSSQELYTLIAAAKNAGASGAKLSGAGRGDCMIAIGSPAMHDHIHDELQRAAVTIGGQALAVEPHAPGARLEKA